MAESRDQSDRTGQGSRAELSPSLCGFSYQSFADSGPGCQAICVLHIPREAVQ